MKIKFPEIEKEILKFWEKNKIFEKSIKKRKKRVRNFVFYEGPPTANGKPGIHHVLTRVFKDIICRYKTMKGLRVERKAGWDTHGLPVELEIEKKLDLKSKKDIEDYGIWRFNKKCKKSVWQYKKDWEELTKRIGYWLDMKNPYVTYDPDYMESVWWILKEIYKRDLLYQGFDVVHYCPRCGTPLSSHEVAQGYKKIEEPSVYVKFKIKDPGFKNSYLLVWTTTPWTLPGNVAIAFNPDLAYVKVKVKDEYFILAKERVSACEIKGRIVKKLRSKDLTNLEYEGLYPFPLTSEVSHNIYRVIPADFVSLEEGTGLVHIAPAFGEEDMRAVKTQNQKHKSEKIPEIPVLITIDEDGKFISDVKKWAGMFFKKADPLIIKDLRRRRLLFRKEMYEHDYPFCWRCKTPLLYYARKTWFIRMKKIKNELLRNNKEINWVPKYLKEGRFGEWLRDIKDWALSRERYWGTPLPIWECQKCQNIEVVGSRKELLRKKYNTSTNKYFILRHGETLYQTEKTDKIYPESTKLPLGLTEKGKKQIENLIPKLKKANINLIFSSDYFRTKETAGVIAKELRLRVKFDKRLRDVDLGVYHKRLKEELYEAFSDMEERFFRSPKGGERWFDCRKRMIEFIKEVDKEYQNKNILIISHGDPLWLLEGAVKGLSRKQLIAQKEQGQTIKPGELREIKFNLLPFSGRRKELNLHRPYIDRVRLYCKKCGGLMKRVPEVVDCWFDSGSMPFAQYHYPFENKKLIDKKKQFPADYICEAVDQTRGWFYTLLAISTLLGKGPSYKNVISLGHILDDKGEKMSKSKGNIIDPWEIAEKYGIDTVRWYFYTANQPGDSKLFSEKEAKEKLKKFIMTLWNCFVFFKTYAPREKFSTRLGKIKNRPVLDRWIISKLNKLILEVTELLEKYDITGAARAIEDFTIEDLSLWYIRRSRKRFQKPGSKNSLKRVSRVLGFTLFNLIKISAPFIPFLSEKIFLENQGEENGNQSIHLENWPKGKKRIINEKLNERMEETREVVRKALAERAKAKIRVRQPLRKLRIPNSKLKKEEELLSLIKEEVNVRKIVFGRTLGLDTKITPELKEEGTLREITRHIQQMRKEAGLTPEDTVVIRCGGSPKLKKLLLNNQEKILKDTRAEELKEKKKKEKFKIKKKIKIDRKKLRLFLKKV